MKGLLQTLKRKNRLKIADHFYKSNDIFHSDSIHICYPLNGFWFRISYLQWSRLLEISASTIFYRCQKGYKPAYILGFKPIPRGQPTQEILNNDYTKRS
jgi:hypothetical protein